MVKGIVGCLVVVVAIVAGALWYGYRKLDTYAAAGPSATVTIGAPAERVFASVASADSLTEWRIEGLGIRASRRGMLRVGDTVQTQTTDPGTNQQERSTWIVSQVVPAQLIAMEIRHDSTGEVGIIRRDSLAVVGDSTVVVTSISSPLIDRVRDSLRLAGDTARGERAVVEVATKLIIAGMRAQSTRELARLKARIEGSSATKSP